MFVSGNKRERRVEHHYHGNEGGVMLGGSGKDDRERQAQIRKARFGPMSAHCSKGHPMKWLNVNPYETEDVFCNSCSLTLGGDYFHHCFACQTDYCKQCGPQAVA